MKRFFAGSLIAVLLAGCLFSTRVRASEKAFQRTLNTLPVVLNAIERYNEDQTLHPGDTLTYGKLINNDNLPDVFCKKTVRKQICGGTSAEEEALHVNAPPISMFDTFAVVRIIVPFWNIENNHRRALTRAIEGSSAILATWNHPRGEIPVILLETRRGALRRFIQYIKQDDATLGSTMNV